jgi:hypothetical protein
MLHRPGCPTSEVRFACMAWSDPYALYISAARQCVYQTSPTILPCLSETVARAKEGKDQRQGETSGSVRAILARLFLRRIHASPIASQNSSAWRMILAVTECLDCLERVGIPVAERVIRARRPDKKAKAVGHARAPAKVARARRPEIEKCFA